MYKTKSLYCESKLNIVNQLYFSTIFKKRESVKTAGSSFWAL